MESRQSAEPTPTKKRAAEVRLTDLVAAALLLSRGCQLHSLERSSDPRRKSFVIRGDRAEISGALDEYARAAATVHLDSFVAAERLLKERLHRGDRIPL